jgi:hypothetical protein
MSEASSGKLTVVLLISPKQQYPSQIQRMLDSPVNSGSHINPGLPNAGPAGALNLLIVPNEHSSYTLISPSLLSTEFE